MGPVKGVLLAVLLVLLACAPGHITRETWRQMSPHDKELYVSSLIGGEKAREQKGGTAGQHSRPPAAYVSRIDAAYARGDHRDVPTLFSEMTDPK